MKGNAFLSVPIQANFDPHTCLKPPLDSGPNIGVNVKEVPQCHFVRFFTVSLLEDQLLSRRVQRLEGLNGAVSPVCGMIGCKVSFGLGNETQTLEFVVTSDVNITILGLPTLQDF